MINGLEGIPGSGKSYEACVFHVLAALKRGRLVITNLPLNVEQYAAIDPEYRDLIQLVRKPKPVLGTWDANRVDDKGNGDAFQLFEPGQKVADLEPVENDAYRLTAAGGSSVRLIRTGPAPVFGNVWDYYSEWRHPDGFGPLYVIDECHVPMPRIGTKSEVIEWFKLHRHFNADVLLATQKFRQMNEDIAELMAMVIKVRKADILGLKDEYIRKVHGGFRGEVISTETRPYKKQYFCLYKSHTQGKSVGELGATDVKPMLAKFKLFQRGFYVLAALAVVWAFWPKPDPIKPLPPPVFQATPNASKPLPVASAAAGTIQDPNAPAQPPQQTDPEPFGGKLIHITGWAQMGAKAIYTFTVSSSGQRIFDLRLEDIQAAGYTFKPLGHCSGFLEWHGTQRAVTCDAPAMAQGTDNRPVVMDLNGKKSTDI